MEQHTKDYWLDGFEPCAEDKLPDHMTVNPAQLSLGFSFAEGEMLGDVHPNMRYLPNSMVPQSDFPSNTFAKPNLATQTEDIDMSSMPVFDSSQHDGNGPLYDPQLSAGYEGTAPEICHQSQHQYGTSFYNVEDFASSIDPQVSSQLYLQPSSYAQDFIEGNLNNQSSFSSQLPEFVDQNFGTGQYREYTPPVENPKASKLIKYRRRKERARYRRSISRTTGTPLPPSPLDSRMFHSGTSNSSDTAESQSSHYVDVQQEFGTFKPTSTLAQRKQRYLIQQMKALADQQADLVRQMRELMVDDERFGGASDNDSQTNLAGMASSSKISTSNSETFDPDESVDNTSISSNPRQPDNVSASTDDEQPLRKHDPCTNCGFKTLNCCTYPGCGYATHSFADYKRHEAGERHWPQNRFMCLECPTDHTASDAYNQHLCEFCKIPFHMLPGTPRDHFLQCTDARDNGTTFGRADHLSEHLRKIHGIKSSNKAEQKEISKRAATWKYPIDSKWPRQCGFCGFGFLTWDERMRHLGEHFQQGLTMKDWKLPFKPAKYSRPGHGSLPRKDDGGDDDDSDDTPHGGNGGSRSNATGHQAQQQKNTPQYGTSQNTSRSRQGHRSQGRQREAVYEFCSIQRTRMIYHPSQGDAVLKSFMPLPLERYLNDPFEPIPTHVSLGLKPSPSNLSTDVPSWNRQYGLADHWDGLPGEIELQRHRDEGLSPRQSSVLLRGTLAQRVERRTRRPFRKHRKYKSLEAAKKLRKANFATGLARRPSTISYEWSHTVSYDVEHPGSGISESSVVRSTKSSTIVPNAPYATSIGELSSLASKLFITQFENFLSGGEKDVVVNWLWDQSQPILEMLRSIDAGMERDRREQNSSSGDHFDIKPANIVASETTFLVTTWNITDFGLSKLQTKATEDQDPPRNIKRVSLGARPFANIPSLARQVVEYNGKYRTARRLPLKTRNGVLDLLADLHECTLEKSGSARKKTRMISDAVNWCRTSRENKANCFGSSEDMSSHIDRECLAFSGNFEQVISSSFQTAFITNHVSDGDEAEVAADFMETLDTEIQPRQRSNEWRFLTLWNIINEFWVGEDLSIPTGNHSVSIANSKDSHTIHSYPSYTTSLAHSLLPDKEKARMKGQSPYLSHPGRTKRHTARKNIHDLDSDYKIHKSKDFEAGKIFRVLWSEPKNKRKECSEALRFVNDGRRGVSICLPISTYGGQGIPKYNTHPDDHTVIYSTNHNSTPHLDTYHSSILLTMPTSRSSFEQRNKRHQRSLVDIFRVPCENNLNPTCQTKYGDAENIGIEITIINNLFQNRLAIQNQQMKHPALDKSEETYANAVKTPPATDVQSGQALDKSAIFKSGAAAVINQSSSFAFGFEFRPSPCLLGGCRGAHVFKSPQSYRAHLNNVHVKSTFCRARDSSCTYIDFLMSDSDLHRHQEAKHEKESFQQKWQTSETADKNLEKENRVCEQEDPCHICLCFNGVDELSDLANFAHELLGSEFRGRGGAQADDTNPTTEQVTIEAEILRSLRELSAVGTSDWQPLGSTRSYCSLADIGKAIVWER